MIDGLLNIPGWGLIAITLGLTHVTIASVTIFLHRHQAHRALNLHPVVSHFFRFWLWLTTGIVTKEWVSIHRKHHAHCESPQDPHSPRVFGIRKVLWEGAELYRAEARHVETLDHYGYGTPNDWIERNLYSRYRGGGVALLFVIDVVLFGLYGITVWAVQMLWIPFWAAGVINGLGHYRGYRNFETPDASTNLFPLGLLIGGEELHNNHHTFGTSAKLSNKWYEFDIGWMYIRILEMAGLAKVKKVAPEPKFNTAKQNVDLDTLQSVISNRYDVMAKYAKSLKRTWHEEVEHLKNKGIEYRNLKASKKLLRREPTQLAEPQKQQLSELLAHSKALKTMHDMRIELAAIWERSHFSREQLLHLLQDWCARAEASGIRALQEFSFRLRSYA